MDYTRKVLEKIAEKEEQIERLEATIVEIASNGYASASIGSSGGSKSYTRLDLDKIQAVVNRLRRDVGRLRSLLAGDESGIKVTYIRYS